MILTFIFYYFLLILISKINLTEVKKYLKFLIAFIFIIKLYDNKDQKNEIADIIYHKLLNLNS